jgi:hypothetical protein
VWAKFSEPPHLKVDFPVRLEFSDYTVAGSHRKYMLVAAAGMEPRLLSYRDGRRVLEPMREGVAYPFSDPAYTAAFSEVRYGAQVKTVWTNESDRLIRPALVATVQSPLIEKEVVLELNTPYHYKTDSGTLVLVYRPRPKGLEGGRGSGR